MSVIENRFVSKTGAFYVELRSDYLRGINRYLVKAVDTSHSKRISTKEFLGGDDAKEKARNCFDELKRKLVEYESTGLTT